MLRTAIALGLLILAAAPASAQHFHHRPGFAVRGPGFGFFAYPRTYYYSYSTAYLGFGWWPAWGPGYGPGFGNPFFLPAPPFAAPPPLVFPAANNVPFEIPPQVVQADFHVIAPKKKDEPAPIVVKPPAPPVPDGKPPGLTEPKLDANQRMKLARDSLVAGEYGEAVEHLDRVLAARPGDSAARFLKSQAQFAAGQYSEAAVTIQTGLRADPDWPKLVIDPQRLFGRPERFDGLFGDLKRSRDGNPDSLVLQFLVAHQNWFAGDRDSAKATFARLADVEVVKPFLK